MPDISSHVSRRDEQHFEALWRDHAPAVVRYARRRVLPGEVDEVVAETFLVAWRRLDEVPEQALPWLFGVARGISANVLRSARRRDALAERLAVQPAHAAHPSDTDAGQLASALSRLSERDRELLTLLAWDGLGAAQAAESLGISRATFAVRLHRARRRLRAALDHDPDPRSCSEHPFDVLVVTD